MLIFSGSGTVGVGPVSDDFNRADSATSLGTSSSGHAWVIPASSGTWGINSNQGYLPTPVNRSVCYIEAEDADATVEVTILTSTSVNTVARQGLMFRLTDNANYLYLYFINNSTLRCYKLVAGAETLLFTVAQSAADGDILKVITAGDQIEVYHNGNLKTTLTESHNQTATKHGLFWENGGAGASIARWEDFSIL